MKNDFNKMDQKIFYEIKEHLLIDLTPSIYLNHLSNQIIFKEYPFILLNKLKKTEQSIKYHPEGSVWNHTMLVVDQAAKVREKSKDVEVFMWAALLHDLGKPDTTRNRKGKITSYDHDKLGAELCENFLRVFTDDINFIQKVSSLVRYHMHMLYVLKDMPYGNPKSLINEVNIYEISLLCRCDRMGREGVDLEEEEENYQQFLKKLQLIKDKNRLVAKV